jgi:hypothetical protein
MPALTNHYCMIDARPHRPQPFPRKSGKQPCPIILWQQGPENLMHCKPAIGVNRNISINGSLVSSILSLPRWKQKHLLFKLRLTPSVKVVLCEPKFCSIRQPEAPYGSRSTRDVKSSFLIGGAVALSVLYSVEGRSRNITKSLSGQAKASAKKQSTSQIA